MKICINCKEFIKYVFENRFDHPFEMINTFCKRPLESNGRYKECYIYIIDEPEVRFFTCCADQGGHAKDETCDMWRAHNEL